MLADQQGLTFMSFIQILDAAQLNNDNDEDNRHLR